MLVAARELQMPVTALMLGPKDHAYNHGQNRLKQILAHKNATLAKAELKKEGAGETMVNTKNLQFWDI